MRQELVDLGLWETFEFTKPVDDIEDALHAVHEQSLIDAIRRASSRGNNLDPDTYTTEISYDLALRTCAGTAAVACDVWDRNTDVGCALCRPPGHHATRKRAMGFCLFNNVAIAAQYLVKNRNAKKIAVVDIDVHHGNGTQDIFYRRQDVFYFSTHQYPFYPGTGWYDETGAAGGEGKTLNIPLPAYSGDQAMLTSINEVIIPMLDRYQPEMIMVSLGFDAHWKDPIANLLLSAETYGECIQLLKLWADKHCNGRFMIVTEGGYDLSAIRQSTKKVVGTVIGEQYDDDLGKSPVHEDFQWEKHIREIKSMWEIG